MFKGQLLGGPKAIYREASSCVKMDGKLSESFPIGVGVRQGCGMSPWLLLDGCMKLKQKLQLGGQW